MKLRLLRTGGTAGAPAATRLALSDDGRRWALVGGGADMAPLANPSPCAVLMTDAQKEHAGGLLDLRGGAPISLYATPAVFEQLTTQLPVLPLLQAYCGVQWHVIPVAGECTSAEFHLDPFPGLRFTALALGAEASARADAAVGEHIALAVQDDTTGRRAFIAPTLVHLSRHEARWMESADCIVIGEGAPRPPARTPGHARGAGPAGDRPAAAAAAEMRAQLAALRGPRKVLMRGAPAAAGTAANGQAAAADGVELAWAGLEIEL
jgi:pyrroloquinoline quinone biosynthesis protein B